ncbi:hypothetical protein DFH09DRAFT_1072149 [Mycena vulgaris]|nr:hypothetical protein DFH09DRAFT_1072149 [Mycena vulgaris]
MLFALVPAAVMLSSVMAAPQSENGLVKRSGPCPNGYYYSGFFSCYTCPAGKSCDGSTTQTPCPIGHYSSGGAAVCPTTPAGFYNNVVGGTAPIACATGKYQDTAGSTSCLATPAGFYNDGRLNGSPNPIACPAGQYQTASCVTTPAGSYNDGRAAGSPSAIACPAGKYQPDTGKSSCIDAPAGSFGNTRIPWVKLLALMRHEALLRLAPAPPLPLFAPQGNTKIPRVKPLALMRHEALMRAGLALLPPLFAPQVNSRIPPVKPLALMRHEALTRAAPAPPPPLFAPQVNSKIPRAKRLALMRHEASLRAAPASSPPLLAPQENTRILRVKPLAPLAHQLAFTMMAGPLDPPAPFLALPVNTKTVQLVSSIPFFFTNMGHQVTAQASCLTTPAGFYNTGDVNGSPTPIPCATGHYQNSPGQSSCPVTPVGFYNNAVGASSPIPCPAGKYQNVTAQTSCITTPAGFYNIFSAANGSPSATACAPGSYQPYAGKNFCYGAPSGRFQSMSGQAAVCGTCCGWAAPLVNNNINPVKCSGSTPNAWPASGDGCISRSTDCTKTTTCAQNPTTGACPPREFNIFKPARPLLIITDESLHICRLRRQARCGADSAYECGRTAGAGRRGAGHYAGAILFKSHALHGSQNL